MDHQVRSSRFQGIAAGPYDARLRVAEDDAVQRIVVGVDGSETSKAALRWAADLARAFGVELEAVRAFRYPPALHDWNALPSNYGPLPELPPEDIVDHVEAGVGPDLQLAEARSSAS